MNQCDGWSIPKHKTELQLTIVVFQGCKYCGGFDCGDTADASSLCPDCLIDLNNNKRFKLHEDYKIYDENESDLL